MKKLLFLFLALSFMLSLAACRDAGSGEREVDREENSSFSVTKDELIERLEGIIDEFNAEHGDIIGPVFEQEVELEDFEIDLPGLHSHFFVSNAIILTITTEPGKDKVFTFQIAFFPALLSDNGKQELMCYTNGIGTIFIRAESDRTKLNNIIEDFLDQVFEGGMDAALYQDGIKETIFENDEIHCMINYRIDADVVVITVSK